MIGKQFKKSYVISNGSNTIGGNMLECPIIINIFGGPCTGKSTTATGVFTLLKMHDVNTEYTAEFAKDLTWEERYKTLNNQYYVWSKQHHRIWRVQNDVDVIITDSPTLFSLVYGKTTDRFKRLVLEIFNNYNNLNFLLERSDVYTENGRNQDKHGACLIDEKIQEVLIENNIDYENVKCNHKSINYITTVILTKLHILPKYVIKEIKDEIYGT